MQDFPEEYSSNFMGKAYLDPEEVVLLEQQATCIRDRLLIRILFRSGPRISEVLGLTTEDIDLASCTMTIQHLKTRIKLACPLCNARIGRNNIFCPKCGERVEKAVSQSRENRRMRTIPLDQETLNLLQDYVKRSGPVKRGDKVLIFGINRHRAWQIVRDCAERAGLPRLLNPESGKLHGVSPHRLRDAFATHAVKLDDSGDGLRLLQEHLGHASFNTTARYRKVAGEELKDWYNRLWRKERKPHGSQA